MKRRDGGPAFPGQQEIARDGKWNQTWDCGMSLRQWYKGMAMQAWITVLATRSEHKGYSDEGAAAEAARLSEISANLAVTTELTDPEGK